MDELCNLSNFLVIRDWLLGPLFIKLIFKPILDEVSTPRLDIGVKNHVNFFKSATRRFGVQKEDMKRHGKTEDGEDDISSPLDVVKGRRHKVGQCKVENL